MGSGQSAYVQKQEEFVRANRDNFKKELKGYNTYQVEGKLRQLYAGTDNQAGGIDVADHIPFHRDLRSKGFRIFINPALINCDKTQNGVAEEVMLPKPKGALKLVQKVGIFLFGKKRFNKYLQILQTP